jgi:hypothetical protein
MKRTLLGEAILRMAQELPLSLPGQEGGRENTFQTTIPPSHLPRLWGKETPGLILPRHNPFLRGGRAWG